MFARLRFARKLTACTIVLSILFALSGVSFATSGSTSKITERFRVENGVLTPVTQRNYANAERIANAADTNPNVISLTTETKMNSVDTTFIIELEGVKTLESTVDRLAVADHVMSLMGYSDDRIEAMDQESKLAYLAGDSIIAQTSYTVITQDGLGQQYATFEAAAAASYPTEDTTTSGVVTSTLSYIYFTNGVWQIVLDTLWDSTVPAAPAVITYYPSIAVQNCHIDPDEYAYMQYTITTPEITYVETEFFGTDDFETMGDSLAGHGRYLPLTFPTPPYGQSYSNVHVYLRVKARVSSVTLGGTFGIYGNFPCKSYGLDFSFSYPWGLSAGLVSETVDIKTELTAKYT